MHPCEALFGLGHVCIFIYIYIYIYICLIPKLRNVCNVFLVRLSGHFYHAVPFPDNPYIYMVYRVLFVFMFNGSFMYPLGFHRVILEAAWCQRVVPPRDRPQAALPLREEPGVDLVMGEGSVPMGEFASFVAPQSAKIIILGFVVVGIWQI